MRKQYTYKPVALRFRRWSRKRYAAFISIQHAVTIGQLSANVSERFQAKNGSVHTSVLTFDKVNDGETEEKENTVQKTSPCPCSCKPYVLSRSQTDLRHRMHTYRMHT